MESTARHSVIQRLDSLVMGTPPAGTADSAGGGTGGNGRKKSGVCGILKDTGRDRSADRRRNITFPDYEELQVILCT